MLTVLQKLDINYNKKTFEEVNNEYENKSLTDEKILQLSNVASLVMTNNPFDIDEWNLYKNNDWDRNIFQSSLRLDDLIINNSQAIEVAKNQTKINQKQDDIIINYLDSCFSISNPVYAAISANSDNFKELLNDPLWKLILSWLNEKNIPLSLMISGIPPTFEVTIHAPLLIASAATNPKGSSHIEGITIIEALFIFS